MASNQTPNLKLCQWEADDEVLRADFNGDNAKIDSAAAELLKRTAALEGPALLLDVAPAQAVSTWRISLAGVDLKPFRELVLYPQLWGSSTGTVQMYFNNAPRAESVVNCTGTISSLTMYNAVFPGCAESAPRPITCRIKCDLMLPRVTCEYLYGRFTNNSNGGYVAYTCLSVDNDLTWDKVNDLVFIGQTFTTKSRVRLYGVR